MYVITNPYLKFFFYGYAQVLGSSHSRQIGASLHIVFCCVIVSRQQCHLHSQLSADSGTKPGCQVRKDMDPVSLCVCFLCVCTRVLLCWLRRLVQILLINCSFGAELQ